MTTENDRLLLKRREDELAQAMDIINAAWACVPRRFRDPDAQDHTGNPLPAAIRAMARALKGAGGGLPR